MKRARQGFTLVEMCIAMAILAIVLGTGMTVMVSGQQSFQQTMKSSTVMADANRAMNRISRRFTGARSSTIEISPAGDSVEFQEVAGWADGAAVWSNDVQIRFEYATGENDNEIDDNGNGFIDEGRVVLVEDFGEPEERRTVLVNGIQEFLAGEVFNGADDNGNGLDDERGLSFERTGNAIVVRMTVCQRDADGGEVARTLTTTVGLRN